MPTVLITGANRGIGLEFARQYAADGWRVIAACREPVSAKSLLERLPAADVVALDVTATASIRALAASLAGQPIDVLIANAGVMSAHPRTDPLDIADEAWLTDFRVNAMGALRVAAAFAPHLAAGERKLIAISSLLGSIGSNGMGGIIPIAHPRPRSTHCGDPLLWIILN